MRKLLLVLLLFPVFGMAQSVKYHISAPNAAHHEAEISVTVEGAKTDYLEFVMSKASPGRYATHEFAKNVYNVHAKDDKGQAITVEKTAPNVFRVKNNHSKVTLHYTLFGNRGDGTYAYIGRTGYHLNIPATFIWVRGLEKAPVTVSFSDLKPGWSVATQLFATTQPNTFTAPDLQYFLDAPIKVAKLHWREWTITNPDQKKYTIKLALEADAPAVAIDSFTNNLKKVVNEAIAVFGEAPAFDNGSFVFIASLNPYAYGDGMEHRNSTMISSRRQFDGSNSFMGTFAHEFFHIWNVERLRPRSLEPFRFDEPNMSEALWLAEGFTQYYTSLLMVRAGLMPETNFFRSMSSLINAKETVPGGKYYTPIENSQRAVFVDAGVAIDETNYQNMFSSYYSYGGALGLALDLQLRTQFNKSLDGFMQVLWKDYGKPEIAYTMADIERSLAKYTNQDFAASWFKQYVFGFESINYNDLLAKAGLKLNSYQPAKGWVDYADWKAGNRGVLLNSSTTKGSPLYVAGIDKGDEILSINGKVVKQPEELEAILAQQSPGAKLSVQFLHQSETITADLTVGTNPSRLIESATSNTATESFKASWIGAKRK